MNFMIYTRFSAGRDKLGAALARAESLPNRLAITLGVGLRPQRAWPPCSPPSPGTGQTGTRRCFTL